MENLKSLSEKYFDPPDSWLETQKVKSPFVVANIASENDSLDIVLDFDRPGKMSAWLRLRDLVQANHLNLKSLKLNWRRYSICTVEADEGYFFCRKIIGHLNGFVQHAWLTGRVEDDIVYVREWNFPDLGIIKDEIRLVKDIDKDFLIWNTPTNQIIQTTK